MATKSGGSDQRKCKAPGRAGPRADVRAALAAALETGDLPAALKAADLTLPEVLRAADRWPEVAAGLLEVHQVIRQRARMAVEASAAAGDLRAIRAMTDGTLDRLDPSTGQIEGLPPHIAAAMIAAGLTAAGCETPEIPWPAVLCPHCNRVVRGEPCGP